MYSSKSYSLPAEHFEEAGDFWATVSATRRGEPHPDHPEFVHLEPADGDMTLELQRLDDGPPSVHLDLCVHDIPAWTERAVACGATLVAQPGHAILTTPGGVPFCTDGGQFAGAGIDSIVCGPGELDQAHQPNESLPREAFEIGPERILEVVRRLCG